MMYPIILLFFSSILTMLLAYLKYEKYAFLSCFSFLLIAFGLSFVDWDSPGLYFNNMIRIDNQGILYGDLLILTTGLLIALSKGFIKGEALKMPFIYGFLQFVLLGALILISYNNLVMLFLGLEIVSIGMYLLLGSRNKLEIKASVKYFFISVFASGIFLFGVALYYGAIGSFRIDANSVAGLNENLFLEIAVTLMIVSLLIKISAAPFHFFAADVLHSSPIFITAFQTIVVFLAGVMALFRMLYATINGLQDTWIVLLYVVIIASLLIGNITAINQRNFKRLLAYSSISHAGFLLLAFANNGDKAFGAILFYAISYALAMILSYAILMVLERKRKSIKNGFFTETNGMFKGLAKNNMFLAVVITIAMLSLSGVPLTAGFWGKFFVLNTLANKGEYVFMFFCLIMSSIAFYYYLKPVMAVFQKGNAIKSINMNPLFKFILLICTISVIIIGIFPNIVRSLF